MQKMKTGKNGKQEAKPKDEPQEQQKHNEAAKTVAKVVNQPQPKGNKGKK